MNAPAEFIVARHLVTHPGEDAGHVATHAGLHRPVVANVIRRFRDRDLVLEPTLLHFAANHPRRVHHRAFHFRVPNPRQWMNAVEVPVLLSGDITAAESDGYNIVPDRWVAYVRPGDEPTALRAVREVFADVAPSHLANLAVKVMDPWLRADDEDSRLAEKGQRLLDYRDSPLLRIAAGVR